MREPGHESLYLDIEDLAATSLHVVALGRHEWRRHDGAVELLLKVGRSELGQTNGSITVLRWLHDTAELAVECGLVRLLYHLCEGGLCATQHHELLDIDICNLERWLELESFAFGNDAAIFGNHALARKDKVGR